MIVRGDAFFLECTSTTLTGNVVKRAARDGFDLSNQAILVTLGPADAIVACERLGASADISIATSASQAMRVRWRTANVMRRV